MRLSGAAEYLEFSQMTVTKVIASLAKTVHSPLFRGGQNAIRNPRALHRYQGYCCLWLSGKTLDNWQTFWYFLNK